MEMQSTRMALLIQRHKSMIYKVEWKAKDILCSKWHLFIENSFKVLGMLSECRKSSKFKIKLWLCNSLSYLWDWSILGQTARITVKRTILRHKKPVRHNDHPFNRVAVSSSLYIPPPPPHPSQPIRIHLSWLYHIIHRTAGHQSMFPSSDWT